jgi:hypothetical protein
LHEGKLADTKAINTGVGQECMFLMVMGDVMNKVILGKKRGINGGVSQQLEDLDFADYICLLSHAFNKIYMQHRDRENRKSCWTEN